MNEVWLALPSANIEMAQKTFPEWKSRGYRIAIICPDALYNNYKFLVDIIIKESENNGYSGWPKSVNIISKKLSDVDIIIAAGDDMYPDKNYDAKQLREQFINHFNGTFGVMQPTGDKFGSLACPECEQICGSAWLGKEFRNNINKGNGPMWEEYWHMYADTELYQVAKKYNCLWIREDLNQYHEHRLRGKHNFRPTIHPGNTKIAKNIYDIRKLNNFPNTELL
jgi:hypothetical protein